MQTASVVACFSAFGKCSGEKWKSFCLCVRLVVGLFCSGYMFAGDMGS